MKKCDEGHDLKTQELSLNQFVYTCDECGKQFEDVE